MRKRNTSALIDLRNTHDAHAGIGSTIFLSNTMANVSRVSCENNTGMRCTT